MISVIIIQSFFALVYLLIKRALLVFYKYEQQSFDKIKAEYYWFEYIYIFTATIVTPKHSYNEGIVTLISVILIKWIVDSMKFIDKILERWFHGK